MRRRLPLLISVLLLSAQVVLAEEDGRSDRPALREAIHRFDGAEGADPAALAVAPISPSLLMAASHPGILSPQLEAEGTEARRDERPIWVPEAGLQDEGSRAARPPSNLRPRLRLWRLVPGGSLAITSGGKPGSGTMVDLDGDLGLDARYLPEVGVDLALGEDRVGVSFLSAGFRGESKAGSSFVFHGREYPAGTDLESELDFSILNISYDRALIETWPVSVRAGGRVYIWDLRTTVAGRTPGGKRLDETRGFGSVRPAVSLEVETRFENWHLDLLVAAGTLSKSRNVLDLEASVGYRSGDRLQVDLGYRIFRLRLSETTNQGTIVLQGLFFGATLHF